MRKCPSHRLPIVREGDPPAPNSTRSNNIRKTIYGTLVILRERKIAEK
jgi:hypothetical protein